jgi:phosphoglycolate phosphatase-like HAD superfamily hydrolase
LIGDTDHDAEVARALGTSVALVALGHQSADRLRAFGSVFEDFAQLTDALLGRRA